MKPRSMPLIALTIALLPMRAPSQQPIKRLDGTTLTADLASEIADAELRASKVMGAQIAILNRGKVVWTHAYGLRNAEKSLPMTVDTNIWAASITKSLFATWVMQLVEQGKVDLDKPISKTLKRPLYEYESYKEIAGDIVKDGRWSLVTPRTLLAHTSGLANFSFLEEDK